MKMLFSTNMQNINSRYVILSLHKNKKEA
jgi:hypothetical protein